jgi:hypothetical protein
MHTWGCYGIGLTKNGVFLLDVASPLSSYDHVVLKDPLHLNFIQLKASTEIIQEFTRLVSRGTRMCQTADMLVFIRAEILKSGSLPNGLENWTIEKSLWVEQTVSWLKVMRFLLKVKKVRQLKVNEKNDNFCELDNEISVVESLILIQHCAEMLLSLKNSHAIVTVHENDKITASLMCKVLQSSENSSPLTRTLAQDIAALLYTGGNIPDVLELCKICGADIPTKHVINEGCLNGHNIGRCCKTLRICQDLPYKSCENCRALSIGQHLKGSNWFEKMKESCCTFCDGLFS